MIHVLAKRWGSGSIKDRLVGERAGIVGRVHVVTRGEGTPLVLIHGFGVDHRALLPLDRTIAAYGNWKRVYLDLPGMGKTPIGDAAGAEDMARVVVDAVRGAVGDTPFAVIGNSFGGMLARRVAHDFGDQVLGLATIAGVFVLFPSERETPARTVLHEEPKIFDGIRDEVADGYRDSAVWQSASALQNFAETIQPGLDAADKAALARLEQGSGFDIEPEDAASAPFTRPALFVTGRQDDVMGYSDTWRRLEHYPRGSFLVLDAAGHDIIGEQPELLTAAVVEWLDRVRAHERSSRLTVDHAPS